MLVLIPLLLICLSVVACYTDVYKGTLLPHSTVEILELMDGNMENKWKDIVIKYHSLRVLRPDVPAQFEALCRQKAELSVAEAEPKVAEFGPLRVDQTCVNEAGRGNPSSVMVALTMTPLPLATSTPCEPGLSMKSVGGLSLSAIVMLPKDAAPMS